MSGPLTDDVLLGQLAAALEPAPIRPTPAELENLRRTLGAATWRDKEVVGAPHGVAALRRLRHPVAVAAALGVLTTGGAAAAVSTNSLPGPLRNIAYAVGLPVTSPALERVDGDLATLRVALNLGDAATIRADAAALSHDLAALGPADRVAAGAEPNLLLAQAVGWLSAHSSTAAPKDPTGNRTSTGEHVGSSTGEEETGEGGGTSGTSAPAGDGSDSGSSATGSSNAGGDDGSSVNTPPSGSSSGDTDQEGSDGDGKTTSGATQLPTKDGGAGSTTDGAGSTTSDGGTNSSDGGSSDSDGGRTSTSDGDGSSGSGSGPSSGSGDGG